MFFLQKLVQAKLSIDCEASSTETGAILSRGQTAAGTNTGFKEGEKAATPSSMSKKKPESKLVLRLGHKGGHKTAVNMPGGVAVTNTGDLVVADTDNHRVLVLSPEGQLHQRIGCRGSLPHQLHHPMCVALTRDAKQHILVTDSVNAAIKVFQQDGRYLEHYYEQDLFDFPYGIALTPDNYIVVTDLCRHSVIILYPCGTKKTHFGCYGDGAHQFDHPYFVAISNQNNIIVCDSGNTCIKFFTMEGTILKSFGLQDFRLLDEHFVILQGITVDTEGNILVVGNSTVYIVAPNGRLWEVILPEDGLYSPKGLAYSPLGQLVLTQCGLDHRQEVSIFRYNMEDFRSLQSIPQTRWTKDNTTRQRAGHGAKQDETKQVGVGDQSIFSSGWRPRRCSKRARSSTSNSSVDEGEERWLSES